MTIQDYKELWQLILDEINTKELTFLFQTEKGIGSLTYCTNAWWAKMHPQEYPYRGKVLLELDGIKKFI